MMRAVTPTPNVVENARPSGRKALRLGRRLHSDIPCLEPEESEALPDAIRAHAVKPELIWHHRRRVGDLVMWDSRRSH